MCSGQRLISLVVVLLCWCAIASAHAVETIVVSAHEDGTQRTGAAHIYFDPEHSHTAIDILRELQAGQFTSLSSQGSTGLVRGDTWSVFTLQNTTPQNLMLYLEYVDHQVIEIDAYQVDLKSLDVQLFQRLALNKPFSARPVTHNRFVVPVEVQANNSVTLLVRFGATEAGYTYPSMRIWSPKALAESHVRESGLLMFLFGGFFLMALFSVVAGFAAGRKIFFLYALYSLSKITCWATILGLTHQHIITDNFHWSLMSISGAVTIVCGLIFARAFLRTRKFLPKADYILILMIVNACLLLIAAIFQIKAMAIITITLALALYPVMLVVGMLRWRQGANEAGIFTLAWATLVAGLVIQALRDLGYVEHNMLNYYLPPVASYIEMITIMLAMGLFVRQLRRDKQQAEVQYREHLEASKQRLENEVQMRTKELERAKTRAEIQANTDELTGVRNRRSFLLLAQQRLELAVRQHQTCCLLMLDLDHFKQINDTHGHGVGDEVLKQFALTVDTLIRETDVFGRFGGEEFVLLITEPCDAAMLLAQRLLEKTADIHVTSGKGKVKITTSIGLACAIPPANIDDLLHRADEAMYEAKRRGRNCVVVAE
ncbi:sensor domain-containing diguanylate cyclase [Alteromonas flava]|uniref:sensor domain-containing diguanylate cyclase n=1 Tax=Alteromonas flava TaxID=2048003 RepID=UPI0013DB0DA3|nr:diguanylate cyclase [Alteromonas flava]